MSFWLAGLVCLLFGTPASRAHESPPGCTGSALGINLFTDIGNVHIGDTIRYSATVFNNLPGSPRLACDASEILAGIVTPDGRTNMMTLRRTTLVNGQSDFYTNVVSYVVRAQDIQPDGTVRATAFDNGNIHQNETDSRGGGNQGVNTEVNQPCIQITVVCTGSVGQNGAIQFTGTVINCGNNTLVGVTVTNFVNDGQFAVLFPTNILRGQSATFSGSWIPSNACIPSTATLVAQGSDEFSATPRTVTSSASTTCSNVLTPGIIVGLNCPTNSVSPGGILTYGGFVQNTGNVTLTNVVVVNNRSGTTPVFTVATLAPGVGASFTASYTVPANAGCSIASTLTGTGNDQCAGTRVAASMTIACPLVTTPAIKVTQVCPPTPPPQGGTLTFSGTVQNVGNTTLTNVVVFNDRTGATPVFTAASLAPGVVANFTGSYAVPFNCCSVSSTVTASGKDICTGATATDTSTATCPVLTAPSIVVTKVCPTKSVEPGDLLKYSGSVSNTGNIALVDVTVNNSNTSSPVLGPITLAPGETVQYTASYIVPPDSCGTDTVTARGFDSCTDALVSNSVTTTCSVTTSPRIAVTQNCPSEPTLHGGVFAYTGTVSNLGNVTLTNVFVVNSHPTPNTPVIGPITLAPGASATFSNSYTAPLICCELTDTLTARGQDRCSGATVTATASTVCPLLYTPRITVTQNCPPQPVSMGELFTFNGEVSNTGDTILTNVFVFSNQPGKRIPLLGPIELAPGESKQYSGSFTVPSDTCAMIVTASGMDTCIGNVVINSARCPVATHPSIAVTQTCPVNPVSPGGLLTYTGTVRNTGDITLNNIEVMNDRSGITPVFTVASLAPGATVNFAGSYTASIDCFAESTSTARATSLCGMAVSNSVRSTCPIETAPRVMLTAVCSPNSVVPGGLLSFSGSVTNIGNIPLTNVIVMSDRPVPNTVVFVLSAATLPPGAGVNFTGSYTVPLNICSVLSNFSVTGRDICTGTTVTNTAAATCPVTPTPSIAVTQNCPANPVSPGGLLTYTGTVRNTGDITLNNIEVINDRSGITPVFTVASLAPGATVNFTGSYTVSIDCSTESTSTARATSLCGIAVSNSVRSTCPIETSPRVMLTAVCSPNSVAPGALLSFSGSVTNIGNIPLTNVIVMSDRPVPNTVVFVLSAATLAPGAGTNFTGSYTVPLNVCSVLSNFSVTGRGICTGTTVTNTAAVTCPVTPTPSLAITQNCPVDQVSPRGLLTYNGSIRNAGNITLNNIVVTNDQSGTTPILTIATLTPGASANFTGSYTAPAFGNTTSTSTVRATSLCNTEVMNIASSTCPILTAPGIAITKACPPQPVTAGGSLLFSGTVTNTGNITLTNVFVVNNQPVANTRVLGPITLAPGVGIGFTASYTVPLDACAITDTLIATANDMSNGIAVSSTVSATCPIITIPSIAITQNCPPNPVSPGGLLTYSGSIRNAGNITLNNIVVTNDRSGATPVLSLATLAAGASATFTGSYTAPASGNATSTSIVRAANLCGVAVTNSASSSCPILTAPGIAITKACPPQPVTAGGTLAFSGTVTNTGNITLTNVFVVNNQPAANTPVLGPITLAPGTGTTFTASYTVPLNACTITDTLIATGNDISNGIAVSSTVSATCPILTIPSIAITQNCPPSPVSPSGLLTYSGSIRNAGNITLNNIVVINNRSGATPVLTLATLAAGASANFTGSYTAPASGDATSTSTVSAANLCGVAVTNSASSTCPILTSAGIAITKACPPQPVTAGGTLLFSGTVTNTGNVTLTNVFVMNNQPAANTRVLGPITLAPGSGTNFSASYTVALDACAISDTLIASGNNASTGVAVASAVSATCPVITIPSIAITQNCPPSPVSPGGLLAYSGSIRNAGTITLNNIVVTNDRSGATPVLTLATLAPGASANFTGSYTSPLSGNATSTSTVRATSLCNVDVTNTASSTCPILTSAGIAITKACPPLPVTAGGTLAFSGTVTNTGNVTLTNVFVVNNQPAANTPVLGPITLAPGAGTVFAGSYAVALDACATTDTLIATGNNASTGIAVTSTVSATCPVITIPSIAITQNCPPTPVSPSGLLTYTGSIRNAGNITLNNIVVTNDRSGAAPVFSVATLAPGAIANFTGSYTAPASGDATSTSTVRATSLCGVAVTNSASSTCPILTSAGIALTKACPAVPVTPGGTLLFTGTITNVGNVALTNVFVVSNQPVANTPVLGPITLAPGAGASFTGSYTVPLDACSTADTLTATGINASTGLTVTSTVSPTCLVTTSASIAMTQSCPPAPVSPGGLLTYTGSIRNAGNITLTNIVVTNDRSGATPILTVASLAPGVSASFTGSYTAPASGDAISTSSVRATSLCSVTVTNTATLTCPIFVPPVNAPRIAVTLACPSTPSASGSAISYTGTVSNTGNVTLTAVTVANNQPAPNTIVLTVPSLAPGASANFTATFTTAANACSVSSTVTASGTDASSATVVTESASATCPLTTTPGLSITQNCPPAVGGVASFNGVVSNTGNITLTNVFVVSSRPNNNTPVLGPITLAPGASAPFSGSYALAASSAAINLRSAASFAVLAGQGITVAGAVTSTTITGDIGTFPTLSISGLENVVLNGVNHAGDAITQTAKTDLVTAYIDAAGRSPTTTYSPIFDLGGLTLPPGVYRNPSSFGITGALTLDAQGDPNAFWIFQTGSTLTTATGSSVVLINGAQAANVFWQVGSSATVGTGSTMRGTILALDSITLTTGASLTGRALARNAVVTLDVNSIAIPQLSSVPPSNTVTATGIDICQARTVTATANCPGLGLQSVGSVARPVSDSNGNLSAQSVQDAPSSVTVRVAHPSGTPVITSITAAQGTVTVSWSATPGVTYTLQGTSHSPDPVWMDIPGNVTASGSTASKQDPIAPGKNRFYRVRVVQE